MIRLRTIRSTAMAFFLSCLICVSLPLNAQNESRFYANTYSQAVFAQIDGDQASGYNKLGYAVGFITGMNLSNSKISAVEFQLGIAERGSRRPPSIEDPSITPFHIRYQTFESALGVVMPLKGVPLPKLVSLYLGLRPYLLFRVEDTEAFMPSIDQDMRNFGALAELSIRYPIRDNWSLVVSALYSASSISKGSSNASIYYPLGNGAYHNNVSFGLIYHPIKNR